MALGFSDSVRRKARVTFSRHAGIDPISYYSPLEARLDPAETVKSKLGQLGHFASVRVLKSFPFKKLHFF